MSDLAELQQHIADNLGISPDALTNPAADPQEVARRQASDLQVSLEVKWDVDNDHPADTPQNRRACRRYVRSNIKRLRQEQKRQQSADPEAMRFVFILFLLEAFLSWLIGKGLDEWWDWKNKTPNASSLVAAMAAASCAVCQAVGATDENLNDDEHLD